MTPYQCFPEPKLAVFWVLMLDFKLRSIYLQMKDAWNMLRSWGWGEGYGRWRELLWYHPDRDFWTRPEPSVLIYPALVRVLECLEALDSEVCPAQLFTFIYVYPLSLSLFFFFFCHLACGILVSRPGIQPACLALEAQSLNHWTTRKAPHLHIFLI